MKQSDTKDLTLLGNQNTEYNYDYNPEILETFENQHQENNYFVKFNIPRVYEPLPDDWPTGFRGHLYFVYSGCPYGGKQVVETIHVQFPESRSLP